MTATTSWQNQVWLASAAQKPIVRHRVLVVDDDAFIRHLISRTLISAGCVVDTAEDGEAAWQILQVDFDYDLLITDQNMPKMSGLELIKKLHAARLSVPVILASGTMPTEELHWHPWLKIEAQLTKPFSTNELLEAMRNALDQGHGVHVLDACTSQRDIPCRTAVGL